LIFNLISSENVKAIKKINLLATKISKAIERLEDKIRSNHRIGSLKIRTTGRITQSIWKRVDFIEFDVQYLDQPDPFLTEKKIQLSFNALSPTHTKKSINLEKNGFLYCVYKSTGEKNKKKLTLIKKKPLLNVSGRSKSKTIKALSTLSNTLNCSNELKKISRILQLSWEIGI
jgi:hypothetical protein